MKVICTDWERHAGFCNDPAETTSWCAWARIGPYTFTLTPENKLQLTRFP